MSTQTPSLAREALLQLLAQTRSSSGLSRSQVDSVEYDWTTPSHFTAEQLKQVQEFSCRFSDSASTTLNAMLPESTALHVEQTTQHYASSIMESSTSMAGYSTGLLDAEGTACGVMILSLDLARYWVAELLGGVEGEPTGEREISAMEDALAEDILTRLVMALTTALPAEAEGIFRWDETIVQGSSSQPGDAVDALTQIELRPDHSMPTRYVKVLLLSETVKRMVDSTFSQRQVDVDGQVRIRLLEHLQAVPIRAHAQLGHARICARDLVTLKCGDVLVLQKRMSDPIDLMVNDITVLQGAAVTYEGRYALQVVPNNSSEDQTSSLS